MLGTYEFSQETSQNVASVADREHEVFLSDPSKKASETMMPSSPVPAMLDVRYDVAYRIGNNVSEVQALFTQLEGKSLRVWTVVPERNEGVYKKIYAREKELISAFDGMDFEFNIIPSLGRNAKEIISDPGSILVFVR